MGACFRSQPNRGFEAPRRTVLHPMRRDLTTTHRPGRAVIRINNSKKSARRFPAHAALYGACPASALLFIVSIVFGVMLARTYSSEQRAALGEALVRPSCINGARFFWNESSPFGLSRQDGEAPTPHPPTPSGLWLSPPVRSAPGRGSLFCRQERTGSVPGLTNKR